MKLRKKRRRAVRERKAPSEFTKGSGRETTVKKKLAKHKIPRACGDDPPPTLVVT